MTSLVNSHCTTFHVILVAFQLLFCRLLHNTVMLLDLLALYLTVVYAYLLLQFGGPCSSFLLINHAADHRSLSPCEALLPQVAQGILANHLIPKGATFFTSLWPDPHTMPLVSLMMIPSRLSWAENQGPMRTCMKWRTEPSSILPCLVDYATPTFTGLQFAKPAEPYSSTLINAMHTKLSVSTFTLSPFADPSDISLSSTRCFGLSVQMTLSIFQCKCKGSNSGLPKIHRWPASTLLSSLESKDHVFRLVTKIKLYSQRYCCRRHDFAISVRRWYCCQHGQSMKLHDARSSFSLQDLMTGTAWRCNIFGFHLGCFINLDAVDSIITWFGILYDILSDFPSCVTSRFFNNPDGITHGHQPISHDPRAQFVGGGPSPHALKGHILKSYCQKEYNINGMEDMDFNFVQYVAVAEMVNKHDKLIPFHLPIELFTDWLTRDELRDMASLHNIPFLKSHRKPALKALFTNHTCDVCDMYVSLFRYNNLIEKSPKHTPISRFTNHVQADNSMPSERKSTNPNHSSRILEKSLLWLYRVDKDRKQECEASHFTFVRYILLPEALKLCDKDPALIPFRLPTQHVAQLLTRDELRLMAALHNIRCLTSDRKPELQASFIDHKCDICDEYVSLFRSAVVTTRREKNRDRKRKSRGKFQMQNTPPRFPPLAPASQQIEQIVNDFCADTSPSTFEESGCAVCGQLKRNSDLTPLQDCELSSLIVEGVSRQERVSYEDPIEELKGPIIEHSCDKICQTCRISVEKEKIPKHALANGLWLGTVPDQLKGLTFSEKMMIARVRHNRAVVRVSSGRAKMVANVIMFANPTPSVYHALPPTREEMTEVLAFIFTGSAQPTDEDFRRTPFLVRREKVSRALDWLKLNHSDYKDLEISRENLESYPLSGVPVVVDYKKTEQNELNKLPSAMSSHDLEEEEGTEEGICPFTVHGITGEEFTKLSITALKARALKHLEDQGKMLGIGHEDKPQSLYDNPQAYPQMFPWLFPYGYGGIGQARLKKKVSEAEHKRCLLMYHDKRFQSDLYFPIVAFNHEQLKAGITGSFLMAKRQKFNAISQRLTSLDKNVLSGLIKRLTDGEHVRPETEEEKACFSVLEDLDHVGGHVKGSLTSKKYMRNELWSLISFLGAPSWFITLSPADNRHPICLYFADTGEKFSPELRSSADRNRLIASNPVAAARFFDLMVRSFIKNVLGVDHEHPGLYGKTSGYYGTVEQQGRLTLHLHLLLWIAGALSPQEVRDRLVSKDSVFQHELIQYLESMHQGEFLTGSMDSVRDSVPMQTETLGGIHALVKDQQTASFPSVSVYKDPTQTLPRPAPACCKDSSTCDCPKCKSNGDWWDDYYTTVDDLLLKSNIHRCTTSSSARQPQAAEDASTPAGSKKLKYAKQGPKGCLDRNGICRARFPRDLHETTTVDQADGHVVMKKLEAYMNTFTPCLTYLMRCNTDVTSLSSGTSIKAIVSYISDYVTKPVLKTHQIFSSMYDVFEKNKVQLGPDVKSESDASRRLILQIVNSLNAKMEIGSPMASMYLLGNPDHYTGHQFLCFWWKSYITYMQTSDDKSQTQGSDADLKPSTDCDRVKIGQENGVYIATTNVDDYKYRPEVYSKISLYEWIQTSLKRRANKKELDKLRNSSSTKSTRNTHHQFEDGHPLRATHVVKCDFDRSAYIVPNIVGGALPRHDAGSREYYCCTMLTLFCPWRNASCVKQPSESWESAFHVYPFSTRQKQLMRNFNLRYECLDARDDFQAQLKKKTQSRTPWYNQGDSDTESDDDFIKMPTIGRIDHGVLGKSYRYAIKMMDSMSSTLRMAGWLDQCSEMVASTYVRLHPEYVPGSSWSNIIKNRCIAIFKDRFASYEPPPPSENGCNGKMKSRHLVRILTGAYFRRDFVTEKKETNDLINNTVSHFSLNEEQERAFRIIANHVSAPTTEQLKMYLGGMGGTGKSQVIKALIHLFSERNENHRFAVLAPTGTAAALLNGSTYHKALGIHRKSDVGQDFSRSESAILNEVRSRLQGVEYVFIDEVSMIACHELYSISARLAQITSMHDAPFGGMNIILAGDFAQLSPVFGSPLYDGTVERYVNSRMSVREQETIIGKVLWHQITTVVILKQNMRQKTQTEADAKLRTALENMRYAACTPDDIAFLKTLIAGKDDKSPSLKDSRFRNVSIITARNNQRDRINEEGSRRFVADHGLELSHFYSLDELAGSENSKSHKRRRKRGQNRAKIMQEPTLSGLTRADQDALWECYPYMSDHVPAKLSLCVGMPVMIRNNEATELCVTKGQEAVVVGWDAFCGPYDHQILETLFVQLKNPPKDVQLADLPMNVIPLTKTVTSIQCKVRSDQQLQIKRQQVPILLNFAMTDYASQGKTREYNVVDLGYSRDHKSYYTALSRSSSAAGTVLIQQFAEHKITGGISGWLRQEFRELNVLDEVTRLRYESRLPENIFGPLRNPVVRAYYLWINDLKDDSKWHSAIQYKVGEHKLKPVELDATWDINAVHVLQKETRTTLKRGATEMNGTEMPGLAVRPKYTDESSPPLGLIWDSKDYSCAYDSLFTVLYNIWTDAPRVWSDRFGNITVYLSMLSDNFQRIQDGSITIEAARDVVRQELNLLDPREYPFGAAFTCLAQLTSQMMANRHSGTISLSCMTCGYTGDTLLHIGEYFQLKNTGPLQDGSNKQSYISDSLTWHLSDEQKVSRFRCPRCSPSHSTTYRPLTLAISMNRLPYLMCIILNTSGFQINETLSYLHNEFDVIYRLRGIVYGDGNHFVARLFTKDGQIWYHDGITTGSKCYFEGNLDKLPDSSWLKTASKGFSQRTATLVVYARD
jgi:hypothetical protein